VRDTADDGSSRRLLLLAGGLAGLVAVGGLVAWGVSRMGDGTIPVVQADARPVKIRPDDRGGLRVANQDEIIFERRMPGQAFDASGRLAPAAEAPNLDALRAATAPPPAAVSPAPPAVPAAPAESAAAPAPAPAAVVQNAAPAPRQPAAAAPAAAPQAAAPAPAPRALQPPSAPSQPAPVAAVAPRTASGNVVVQLGALDSEAGARAEWERLAKRAPDVLGSRRPQVIRFEREGKPTMWRLRTSVDSRDSAGSLCESVRSAGGACAVVGG
jgi:hypothetical protein